MLYSYSQDTWCMRLECGVWDGAMSRILPGILLIHTFIGF